MTASIHRRVLMWALGALAIGACMLVGGSWWLLAQEMREVFEDNLKQVALAVAGHHDAGAMTGPPRLAQQLPRIYEEHGTFEFVTQVWSREGRLLHSSDEGAALPFLARSGMSTVTVGPEKWHLYTIVLEDGVVQAAQRASERESLARETASSLIMPALVMLVAIAGLLALALRRGLAPLSRAAGEVTARSVEALHPIPLASHPPELHLLVSAINDLMARLGSALALQREFLADAAHELRTPITALRLQLQLLERASGEAQRAAAQDELRAGIARAQHLVEQLLQLSRLGPETPALKREPVDLGELARAAVIRFSPRADAQGVDLGVIAASRVSVQGDSQQLTILLNNLVDNALRHTPQGGRVDVSSELCEGRPCLSVADTGPGIPAAERERVFDRFYRSAQAAGSTGSGLGLAIVRAVAQRHGAQVRLADAAGGGLLVSILFASD
jgi:two-component system, OmpR family, sensor kinase